MGLNSQASFGNRVGAATAQAGRRQVVDEINIGDGTQ